jgi:flagellar protein FliO/FliZ
MEDHMLQIALYLMGIVTLIFCSGYLLKKINRSAFQVSGPMKVVTSLSLGIKEKLVLVQLGDHQQVLLGVSPERISRIEVFDEPVIPLETEGLSNFHDKLQEIMKNVP